MPRNKRRRKKTSQPNDATKYELINLGKWTNEPKKLDQLVIEYDQTINNKIVGKYDESQRLVDLRQASIVHKQVRQWAQENLIKPGTKLTDIANGIENKIVELFGKNNMDAGIGFPTGLSINHIAAHDSANPKDERKLEYGDVCKVDYGTHVNGQIIDSAFTVAFDPKFQPLLEASSDGTWTGIRLAGPDARINEISQGIKEAIESYEIELDGKTCPIKPIKNLGGHNIEPYKIHANKLVLCSPDECQEGMKMDEEECFAIETFATTGSGLVSNDYGMKCNHYMRVFDPKFVELGFKNSKRLYSHINKTRSTLPFCTRWLDSDYGPKYNSGLNDLVNKGLVESYPPLVDIKGSYTSQLEHTIFLHEYGKEVLSKGDDY